jgi:hypothetical protein
MTEVKVNEEMGEYLFGISVISCICIWVCEYLEGRKN